jgi:DNA-binding MarR family transcriptional regulator
MSLDYTMPQLKVLLCLYINGPYRMSDLAAVLGVSTPTATGIVNRLVSRGVISRGAESEDRRVVTCQITDSGERDISALWLAKFEVFRDIFGTLTPEELEIVARAEEVVLTAARRTNGALATGGPDSPTIKDAPSQLGQSKVKPIP